MRAITAFFVWLSLVFSAPLSAQDEPLEIPPELQQVLDALDPQSGEISLSEAKASLDLGDAYIFYDKQDTRTILVDIWGNPPSNADGALGMVMPVGTDPITSPWGAVISFEETGYVSDDDAADTDYDELLEALQEGTEQANSARVAQGYPSITLVGWAEAPNYDRSNHSVVWAQNVAFADTDVNTLNYDVRTLGRYGVLSLNLVSEMPQLPEIRIAAQDFAAQASFDAGARYQDFDPSVDRTADYGVAGLIAGGAGAAAVAKKTGLIGVILAFLAKFGKIIAIGAVVLFGAAWGPIKRMFGKGDEEYYEEYYEEESGEDVPAEDVSSEVSEGAHDASEAQASEDQPNRG